MRNLIITILVLLASSVFSITYVLAEENKFTERDYSNASPSEIHKILAEMKAGNLGRRMAFAAEAAKAVSLYNQEDYDVRYYNINLDIDVSGHMINGVVTMQAEVVSTNLDTIEVDFYSNMTVDSIYNQSGTLNYLHTDNKITIELDKIYGNGEMFTVIMVYNGTPTPTGLYGFVFDENSHGDDVASSLSEPMSARSWWPCKDRPDDKADSLDIFITCDTSHFCASNGTLIDTTRNDGDTWTFSYKVGYPIATYLFSVAISNYSIWTGWYHYGSDSMPIINHVYPENLDTSLISYSIVPEAIGIFADLFGEYPFVDEKYGHANFGWVGAMEHQTISSMTGSSFGFNIYVIIHELAHQWWGDMITCNNWHEIWLNEGFATYSEALYFEIRDGVQAYHDYIAGLSSFFEHATIYVYDITDPWNIFNSIVYDKGARVLHMLRHIVGDETFFTILQTYYGGIHQYGDATTEDFKNICENISGIELDYFFDEWIYGAYFPHYHWSYFIEPDPSNGEYYTYFHLRQGASTSIQVFSMPLDLVFSFGSLLDTLVVFNNNEDTVYIIKTDENPLDIDLDPDDWVLKWGIEQEWTYQLIPFELGIGQLSEPYLDSVVARGGNGDNRFTITWGYLPPGLDLDFYTGLISGTPTEGGNFVFDVYAYYVGDTISDTQEYLLSIVDFPGDANNDDEVNLLDITFLINYLYKGGSPPEVPGNADPNQTCTINILDITYLIVYLYKDGPEPLWGCAK